MLGSLATLGIVDDQPFEPDARRQAILAGFTILRFYSPLQPFFDKSWQARRSRGRLATRPTNSHD